MTDFFERGPVTQPVAPRQSTNVSKSALSLQAPERTCSRLWLTRSGALAVSTRQVWSDYAGEALTRLTSNARHLLVRSPRPSSEHTGEPCPREICRDSCSVRCIGWRFSRALVAVVLFWSSTLNAITPFSPHPCTAGETQTAWKPSRSMLVRGERLLLAECAFSS